MVVVPRCERNKVLHSLHEDLGHWDSAATKSLLAESFWWPGHLNEATRYVKTCDAR